MILYMGGVDMPITDDYFKHIMGQRRFSSLPMEEAAREFVKKPRDFGWHAGPEDKENWGLYIADSGQSGLLDKSNFEVISKDLQGRFPDDVSIERFSHWAVGSVDQMA